MLAPELWIDRELLGRFPKWEPTDMQKRDWVDILRPIREEEANEAVRKLVQRNKDRRAGPPMWLFCEILGIRPAGKKTPGWRKGFNISNGERSYTFWIESDLSKRQADKRASDYLKKVKDMHKSKDWYIEFLKEET